MIIDMHNHTSISSPCSRLSAEELITEARNKGIDGICVTEHFKIAGADKAQEAGRKLGFPVFRGIEARTVDYGDILVYGYYEDIPRKLTLQELADMVQKRGGVLFAAHPFRLFGLINLYSNVLLAQEALERKWENFRAYEGLLDGLEVINGQLPDETNSKARSLQVRARLKAIGGSDAHTLQMIGKAGTFFHRKIRDDADLVLALREEAYYPILL